MVGDLGGIREDAETGDSRSWGDHGNLDLHGWAFDRFTTLLDYQAEAEGIDVALMSEHDTSKSCSACDTVANADVSGAENIRQGVLSSLVTDGGDETQRVSSAHQNASRSEDGDRDDGWLAQPAVRLFDRSEDVFTPPEQVANREP
mgnify:FL=1